MPTVKIFSKNATYQKFEVLKSNRNKRYKYAEFLVEGVDTNIDFQLDLLRDKNFETARYDIGYLGRKLAAQKKSES